MANPLLKGLEEFGVKYVGKQGVPKSVSEGLGFLGSLAGGGPLAAFLLGMAPKTVAHATYEEGESKMADEVYRYPEVNFNVPSAGETVSETMINDQSSLPLAALTGDPRGGDFAETLRLDKNRWSVDSLLRMLRQGSITEEQLEQDIGREDSYGPYLGGRGEAPERRAVIKSALAIFRREKARAANRLNESRFQGPSPDQNLRTWDEAFQADQDIAQKTYQSPPASGAAFASPGGLDEYSYMEKPKYSAYGELTPDVLPRKPFEPYQTAPGWALGGPVTPAGPGTFPQTASENMMAMGGSPPPDEFGENTPVPSSDAQALIQALDAVRRAGTVDQVRGFISSNMANLLTVASQDPSFANRLQSIIESMPKGGDILRETGVEYGDPRLSNQDIRGIREVMEQLPSGAAGMPADRMNLLLGDQEPSPSLEPYDPLAGSPFVPPEDLPAMMPDWGGNKYAHGGYVRGRGTMPGELHRRGSLPVRVAGESMGEYRKHREDEDDVRPVRRTLDNALSPTLSRRMFS